MNYKTTLVLLVLVVAAGLGWFALSLVRSDAAAQTPPEILDADVKAALQADKSKEPVKIVLEHGGQTVTLNRPAGDAAWSMPGNWPPDTVQVKELIRLLTGMNSRFVAIPVKEAKEWSEYGLKKPLVTVTLRVGKAEQKLQFGRGYPSRVGTFGRDDEPSDTFYQATYLRRGQDDEVIQLEPGLAEKLRRPRSAFQQNWLFLPEETVIKSEEKADKGKRALVIKSIAFTDKQGPAPTGYTLRWTGSAWELTRPVHDRLDPEKLKTILKDLPDIWAERFVDEKDKGDKFGLKEPARELSVTRGDGKTVTVEVGKQSREVTRTTMQPPPRFGMPPMPKMTREVYHYARLKGNAQVFEVNIDKLKSLSVPVNSLRDPSVVKFKNEDARRLEVELGGKHIVLAKPKDDWLLEKPVKYDADYGKVTDLLSKLSGLQVKDQEIIDPDPKKKDDLKTYGLDKPAGSVVVSLEESGEGKKAGKRQVKVLLGKYDREAKKLYVRVEGRERITAVDGELFDLARRPALAYRGKNLFKFSTADLARIEVDRPGDPFTLEAGKKDDWQMIAPVKAGVDADKARKLAGDLSTLDVVDFVADNVGPKALDETYGLAKPALTVKLFFKDAKKPPLTLSLGKKRPGQLDYYAKLASDPAVFAVKEELFTTLDRPSLAYRSLDLLKVPADELAELRLMKDEEFKLKHEGAKWRITAPFEAAAGAELVQPLTAILANLRAESCKDHAAKKLDPYGLDKPYLRLAVTVKKKDDKKGTERELLIGKPADEKEKGKGRFAKLGDSAAVFVLPEATVAALDRSPFELLDRNLLALKPESFRKIESKAGDKAAWSAGLKDRTWQVTGTPAGDFPADAETVDNLVNRLANLRVQKFAAYGPKVDLDKYGLKKPTHTLVFAVEGDDKKKMEQHTLLLGAEVKDGKGARYMLLDKNPGVGVLDAATVKEVTPGPLALVNHTVLEFKEDDAVALERTAGKDTLAARRAEDKTWTLEKPARATADKPTLDGLVARLSRLRGKDVIAVKAKDLKTYGLDEPTAKVTVQVKGADGKTAARTVRLGKPVTKDGAERYAVAEGGGTVVTLPADLCRKLLAPPLAFRNRSLADLGDVEAIQVEHGKTAAERKKTIHAYVNRGGLWKVRAPNKPEADADETGLKDFLKALAPLRADQLVAEKAEDLKKYGLDQPRATWIFVKDGEVIQALLLGAREKVKDKDGPRAYTKLATGDMVFLLDPALTKKFEGNFRKKTP